MLVILFSVICVPVSASSAPYHGYIYDPYSTAVPAPIGYQPGEMFLPEDIGVETLIGATDMFTDGTYLYISDTPRNRIVVLDKEYKFVREYLSFAEENGTVHELANPRGISIQGDTMVVCNTDKGEVLLVDENGIIKDICKTPVGESIAENYSFKPLVASLDAAGYLYVRSDGDLQGLLSYDLDLNFIGYYGANKVKLSAGQMINYYLKKILSSEAENAMIRFVPAEVTAVDIPKDGFLYVVTQAKNGERTDRLRKLNALGLNILNSENALSLDHGGIYGDLDITYTKDNSRDTRLVDVCVDDNGFIATLDQTHSRVFIYDQESNLITVFGAEGKEKGSVVTAASLELFDGNYVVLDTARGCLVTYEPTDFIKTLLDADKLFMEGHYAKAEELWKQVLTYDGSNVLALRGIGKSLLEKEQYKEALEYLEYGQDRIGYSIALQEYRKEYLRDNWLILLVSVVAVVVVFVSVLRFIKKKLGVYRKREAIKFS